MKDIVAIKTFKTRLEAEIAKGALQANDIEAFVTSDDGGGMYPYPMQPTPKGVQLFVKNADIKKSLQILSKDNK